MQTIVKSIFLTLLSLNISTVVAEETSKPVTEQLVDTMTKLAGGPHAGYRANHAKGIVVTGESIGSVSERSPRNIMIAPAVHATNQSIATRPYSNHHELIVFGCHASYVIQ